MGLLIFLLDLAEALAIPIAGAYRTVAYKLNAFRDRHVAALACLGVAIAYPYYYLHRVSREPTPAFVWSFLAYLMLMYVQMIALWVSERPRREDGRSHCWLGRAEPLLALGLAGSAECACGTGRFFLVGYVCSQAQIGIVRLRRWCLGLSDEERERIVAPILGVAFVTAQAGGAAVRRGVPPARAAGRLAFRVTKRLLVKPARDVPASQPTILGRFAKFMGWSFVFNTITSAIGLNLIAIPLAITLWLMGFKIQLPERIRWQLGQIAGAAKELAAEKKEEIKEEFAERREAMGERVREGREALRERAARGAEALGDEVERRGKRVLRGAIWGGED